MLCLRMSLILFYCILVHYSNTNVNDTYSNLNIMVFVWSDLIYYFSSRSVPGLYGWRPRILIPCRLVVTRNYSIRIAEGLGKNDRFCCYLVHCLTEGQMFTVPLSIPLVIKCEWPRLSLCSGMQSWALPSWKHFRESFTPNSFTL